MQAGSAPSTRPLQSSSRPLLQISTGLVGTHELPRLQLGSDPLISSTRFVPAAATTAIRGDWDALVVNAIFRPSGDQAGSRASQHASCCVPDPSAFVTRTAFEHVGP